tara:strand:- start:342 stop:1223 length:882 start_codon:yes stop_codon:yes gene_type:complete
MTNVDKKTPKNPENFYCEDCNFKCSKLSEWKRHISTAKHKKIVNVDKKTPKNATPFVCECGKSYKQRQGLSRHKKICKFNTENAEEKNDPADPNDPSYKELLIKAMKDMSDMRKEMVSMIPLIGNTTNNNNTTNNTFNLQFFLNNDCKDALNLTDFIDSLRLQLNDLEYTTDNGHVKGITNIFQTALSNLEETKRPMHCTDLKREVLYIKDNDKWHVDEDKEIIKGAVETVANKNIGNTGKWLEKYPGHMDPGSKDFEKYVKMTTNLMGSGEELEQNKIIKNICKEVKLDKKK